MSLKALAGAALGGAAAYFLLTRWRWPESPSAAARGGYAREVDDRQTREAIQADAQRRAAEQARAETRARAQVAPRYEVIRRPDGQIGYYQAGAWVPIVPGQRMRGPTGKWGEFDAAGTFYPSTDQDGNREWTRQQATDELRRRGVEGPILPLS